MLGFIVIAVVLVGFVALCVALRRMQARHAVQAAAVGKWATDHGYTYVERDDQTWAGRWRFTPFGIGDYQHANHVVTGKYGDLDFAAFDYEYQLGGAQNRSVLHFAVIVVTLPQPVPWLDVYRRRRHLTPHHDKNQFEIGDKAFDDDFMVHAENQEYALSALTPALRSMVIDQQLQGIHVVDGRLFGWKDQVYHSVETLPGRLAALAAAAAALPPAPVTT